MMIGKYCQNESLPPTSKSVWATVMVIEAPNNNHYLFPILSDKIPIKGVKPAEIK